MTPMTPMNDKQKELALDGVIIMMRWLATNTEDEMTKLYAEARKSSAPFDIHAALRRAAAGQAIETIQEMRDLLEEACHSMDRCGLLSHADKIRAYLSK